MTPSRIVHAFMDAVAVKDYDTALKYIAATCEYDNVPMGKVTGPEGVRAVLEPFFAPTIENQLLVKRELAQGNTVILERLDRHLLDTGWVELPVTGIFEVENGQITLYRDYFDLNTIMSKWPQPGA
jgi:limonene-1,2-epoxide hydrolase